MNASVGQRLIENIWSISALVLINVYFWFSLGEKILIYDYYNYYEDDL